MIKLYDGYMFCIINGVDEKQAVKELNLDDDAYENGGSYMWHCGAYYVNSFMDKFEALKKNHKNVSYSYEL